MWEVNGRNQPARLALVGTKVSYADRRTRAALGSESFGAGANFQEECGYGMLDGSGVNYAAGSFVTISTTLLSLTRFAALARLS